MNKKWIIGILLSVMLIFALAYTFWDCIMYRVLVAQDQVQAMQEIQVTPNVTTAQKAFIPKNYGRVVGVENVGKSTMLWLEAANGTIRRVQVSFWKDDIILDDKVVIIERR